MEGSQSSGTNVQKHDKIYRITYQQTAWGLEHRKPWNPRQESTILLPCKRKKANLRLSPLGQAKQHELSSSLGNTSSEDEEPSRQLSRARSESDRLVLRSGHNLRLRCIHCCATHFRNIFSVLSPLPSCTGITRSFPLNVTLTSANLHLVIGNTVNSIWTISTLYKIQGRQIILFNTAIYTIINTMPNKQLKKKNHLECQKSQETWNTHYLH